MMRRVIHIDTAKSWRGGQQQAAYLHQGLIRRGWDSLMVCPPESGMESWCRDNNLSFMTLPLKCEADLFSAIRMAGCICKGKHVILHAHNAHALTIALMADFLSGGKTRVVASRRVNFSLKAKRVAQWKYRTSRLSRIVCISHEIYRVMRSHGIPEEKLTVIPSGIDVHKFDQSQRTPEFRNEFGIPEDHRIVCTVAALTGDKDYPTFLQAAKKVIQEYPAVTFIAVGDGKKAGEIRAMAEDKVLKSHIIFTGFRSDVGPFVKNSDIFVMASKKEGLGTSILDAESAGLPIIGTDAGGIPEAVRHGENGLIVPRQNPEALAQGILTLLKDEELRKEYGRKSLEVVRNFHINKTVDKHVILYEEIIETDRT